MCNFTSGKSEWHSKTMERIKGIDTLIHKSWTIVRMNVELLFLIFCVCVFFFCRFVSLHCIISWILIEVQQSVTNSGGSLKSNQFFLLLFYLRRAELSTEKLHTYINKFTSLLVVFYVFAVFQSVNVKKEGK